MTSAYPQLMQDMWSNDRGISAIEALMRPHEFNNKNDHNRRTNDSSRQMSEMSYLEEQHERNQLNIRNFGYHWLKPIGVAKTMGQIEDEAREVHESYEEYDDEEGEFNQNNPDMNGGMEGQESLLPEETSEHQEEEEDLDQGIEEGASFDVEETSFVSSAPMTPAQTSSGLYTVVNGAPVSVQSQYDLMCSDVLVLAKCRWIADTAPKIIWRISLWPLSSNV